MARGLQPLSQPFTIQSNSAWTLTIVMKISLNNKLFAYIILYSIFFGCINLGIFPALCNQIILIVIFFAIIGWYLQRPKNHVSYGTIAYLTTIPFIIWGFYICFINGFSNPRVILRMMTIPAGYLKYLLPLIIFTTIQVSDLTSSLKIMKIIFRIYSVLIIFVLIYLIYANIRGVNLAEGRNAFEAFHRTLAFGLVFCILFQDHFDLKSKKLLNFCAFLTIICAAIMARRGMCLSYILAYTTYFFLKYLESDLSKKFIKIIMYTIVCIGLYIVAINYGETLFPTLTHRLTDDTRSIVETDLLNDLSRSHSDYMFGRGINARYRTQFFGDTMNRDIIETGYLDILLKGGLVSIVLHILWVLPAMLLGMFCSQNNIIRRLAFYILLYIVIANVGSSSLNFTARFYFCCISVFLCYSPTIRKMNNQQLKLLLK